MIIAITLTLVEFVALPLVAIIFGVTIYYFLQYRRTLSQALASKPVNSLVYEEKKEKAGFLKTGMAFMEERLKGIRVQSFLNREKQAVAAKVEKTAPARKLSTDDSLVQELKTTIAQQQKLLHTYLLQVEELETEGRQELRRENNDLQREITKLHGVIESKDNEIEELYQQATSAKKMAARIDEVYHEFEQLQTKMAGLEKQAAKANNLAIELEDTRSAYEQIHKELARKMEKLEEFMSENQRLRHELDVIEDKLADANLQRQQLQKKVQFLQELNTDMQGISDTNKKLQSEIRRIGELESMLNIMAEEREFLLKKK